MENRNFFFVFFFVILATLCFLPGLPVFAQATKQRDLQFITNAVYLGVKGYGTVDKSQVAKEDFVGFRFSVDGTEKLYSIKSTPDFSIQNKLQHGESYNLVVVGNRIENAMMLPNAIIEYTPPVLGKPNVITLKNLLATAMEPVGTVLYVFGGGWNWQDDNGDLMGQDTGLKNSWVKFFRTQDSNYNYKFVAGTDNKEIDKSKSFYPFGEWNEFHYAGLDCSGYLGWVLDNFITRVDGKKHTINSVMFAKNLSDFGLGTVTKDKAIGFKPGAIASIKGHVYMCVGTCEDGSIVILHSTPSESKNGENGGGVQLSALNPRNTGKECDAYRLAKFYMERYFPKWSKRYCAELKDYSVYTDFAKAETTGIFNWAEGVLPDPDGYCTKNASEILKDLFSE